MYGKNITHVYFLTDMVMSYIRMKCNASGYRQRKTIMEGIECIFHETTILKRRKPTVATTDTRRHRNRNNHNLTNGRSCGSPRDSNPRHCANDHHESHGSGMRSDRSNQSQSSCYNRLHSTLKYYVSQFCCATCIVIQVRYYICKMNRIDLRI